MFDEGENEVTINLPQIIQQYAENASATAGRRDDVDEGHQTASSPFSDWNRFLGQPANDDVSSNVEKKENPIRDYSMDTWNGNAGLKYWGYSEEHPQKEKYVSINICLYNFFYYNFLF